MRAAAGSNRPAAVGEDATCAEQGRRSAQEGARCTHGGKAPWTQREGPAAAAMGGVGRQAALVRMLPSDSRPPAGAGTAVVRPLAGPGPVVRMLPAAGGLPAAPSRVDGPRSRLAPGLSPAQGACRIEILQAEVARLAREREALAEMLGQAEEAAEKRVDDALVKAEERAKMLHNEVRQGLRG